MVDNQAARIRELGSILGIWAHPDDETWSSAGLMRIAGQNGQKIGVVTATRGEGGETSDEARMPKSKLAEIRTVELAKALSKIAEIEHTWLDYKDGKMADADQQKAVKEIALIINEFKPDTILTFEENGITGHEDHKAIHRWAVAAAELSSCNPRILCAARTDENSGDIDELDKEFNISMTENRIERHNTDHNTFRVDLSPKQLDKKIEAMREHHSQLDHMFASEQGTTTIRDMASRERFMKP